RHHYRPQGPGDAIPTQAVAATVALADKLDTLVGFFAIDERPTGSRDPFALRRAALGVLKIILGGRIQLELRGNDLLLDHLRRYPAFAQITYLEAAPILEALTFGFLEDRLEVLLRDQGDRVDVVRAVFERTMRGFNPLQLVSSVEALSAFLATDDGANLLAGYKRAVNILKAEEKKGALPEGEPLAMPGAAPEEATLIAAVAEVDAAVAGALEAEDFAVAMQALANLRAPVDAFFDKVLVNSEVAAERENRLRLLARVRDAMGRVADFGQVTG
ncbi:glycine--tRNA ligase subunit beta, partial [Phenylobacterium sp.]|uniref:glycine--tRNA ligase subunit beta n=1 Tax=Phenylobacterium sp. TaxID=1871053 RepID=UPI003983A8DA